MDPIPIFDINLSKDATIIFTLLNQFKHTTEKNKRSFELDDLPQRIEFIPWRRVYKLLAAENINYHNRDHWDAGEMSFSGTGALWCFTELQRSGENVTRKTEDGQSWSGKTGRLPKKGYPSEILVAKLVISSKEFHMLEHTLNEERPTVALCKIWRGGTSTVASPETQYPNVFSPGASTSQQVLEEDHGFIDEGITGKQIEQPQGQLEAIAQQHVPSSALSMSGYILLENYKGSVRSIGQDDNSTYQDSISFLHDTKESFAMLNGDEGHNIASLAKNLASCFTNALHRTLGIVTAPETNRPSTSNNTQLMEAEAVGSTANPDEIPPLPETVTQDDFIMDPDPDLDLDQFEGFSMVDIDSYLNDIA